MIKKVEEFYCDVCEVQLHDNGTRTNCNEFQEPYFSKDSVHLCFECAGKILLREIQVERDWIKSLRKDTGKEPKDTINLDNILLCSEPSSTTKTLDDI